MRKHRVQFGLVTVLPMIASDVPPCLRSTQLVELPLAKIWHGECRAITNRMIGECGVDFVVSISDRYQQHFPVCPLFVTVLDAG
jgi:hypothetical protein